MFTKHILLRLRETHNALQLPVFFFRPLVFLPALSGISGNSEQKITEHRTAVTIHSFRDSVLKIHGCYKDTQKVRATFHSYQLSKRCKAIVCWCKQPISNNFQTCLYCIYLLKLYDKSIIILLTNDLTNI